MNNFRILTDTITQYKNLTSKEEKLFYYAYGKFQTKILSILKENEFTELNEIEDYHNYSVNVDYSEISLLQNVERVDRNNFRSVTKKLIGEDSFITCYDTENDTTKFISIYDTIEFDNKNKKVRIVFTKNIMDLIKNLSSFPYTNIIVKDLENINNSYELKLYLYCLTLYREKNKSGIINMKIDNLRNILSNNSTIPLNKFYSRFINIPCENIKKNNELKYNIKIQRKNENIIISVFERKDK